MLQSKPLARNALTRYALSRRVLSKRSETKKLLLSNNIYMTDDDQVCVFSYGRSPI